MFYAYIITNKFKGALYTGHTDNLGQRMEQHRHKIYPGWASERSCKYLLWFEEFESRDLAFKRERRIKKWMRSWKIGLIEKDTPHWLDIMACPLWPLPEGELFTDVRAKAFREARIPIGKPSPDSALPCSKLFAGKQ